MGDPPTPPYFSGAEKSVIKKMAYNKIKIALGVILVTLFFIPNSSTLAFTEEINLPYIGSGYGICMSNPGGTPYIVYQSFKLAGDSSVQANINNISTLFYTNATATNTFQIYLDITTTNSTTTETIVCSTSNLIPIGFNNGGWSTFLFDNCLINRNTTYYIKLSSNCPPGNTYTSSYSTSNAYSDGVYYAFNNTTGAITTRTQDLSFALYTTAVATSTPIEVTCTGGGGETSATTPTTSPETDLSLISSWTDTDGYTYYYFPFLVWVIFAVVFIFICRWLIMEFVIRMRRRLIKQK